MAETPYRVFRFLVEIDGLEVGGFSQVAGIERSTEFEEFREGGVNDHVHKLATLTKHPNLTLRRGLSDRDELWGWHQDVVDGSVRRRTITVVLHARDDSVAARWIFADAYPVKWNGTDLDAVGDTILTEAVEFVHRGMRRG